MMSDCSFFFFFNDTATTEIYTLSLHDALPILAAHAVQAGLLGIGIHGADSLQWAQGRDAIRSTGAACSRLSLRGMSLSSKKVSAICCCSARISRVTDEVPKRARLRYSSVMDLSRPRMLDSSAAAAVWFFEAQRSIPSTSSMAMRSTSALRVAKSREVK